MTESLKYAVVGSLRDRRSRDVSAVLSAKKDSVIYLRCRVLQSHSSSTYSSVTMRGLLLLAGLVYLAQCAEPPPEVLLEGLGTVVGSIQMSRNNRTIHSFQGIPFAESPTASRRFQVRFWILSSTRSIDNLHVFFRCRNEYFYIIIESFVSYIGSYSGWQDKYKNQSLSLRIQMYWATYLQWRQWGPTRELYLWSKYRKGYDLKKNTEVFTIYYLTSNFLKL